MTQTNDNTSAGSQIDAVRAVLSRLDDGQLTPDEARGEIAALFAAKSEGPIYQKAWG